MKKTLFIAAAAAFAFGGMTAAYAGPEGKCAACHSFKAGENKTGPSLAGIVGKKAGTTAGFAYSDGFKKAMAGKTWDEASLTAWMADSPAMAAGTKMPKQNVDAAKAAKIVEFLKGTH